MNIVKIPFVKLLDINLTDTLELKFKKELTNHIGSLHAGALYTLAETQSGLFLQKRFKEYKNALPILRAGEIKYKKESKGAVSAIAKADKESLEKFENTLSKRAKALISVKVELYSNSELVATAKFSWFVQLINKLA